MRLRATQQLAAVVAIAAFVVLLHRRGSGKDDELAKSNTCAELSCLLQLSSGRWELATDGCPADEPGVLTACDNARTPFPRQWAWAGGGGAAGCVPRELRHGTVLSLLRNRRVGLVGDSHLRKLYGYLTVFLADDTLTKPPRYDEKKHVDYSKSVKQGNVSVEFYWRAELGKVALQLQHWVAAGDPPDLVVLSAAAHQAKWARNFTGFKAEVPPLVEAVRAFDRKFRRPLLWLISPPFRESFSRQDNVTWMYSLKRFNSVLREADGLLQPGGPVIPIDLFEIAQGCMDWCYQDTTHVVESVNTLLWQIITGAYAYALSGAQRG